MVRKIFVVSLILVALYLGIGLTFHIQHGKWHSLLLETWPPEEMFMQF